jgi:transcriptional antiterminator NusG
MNSDSSGLNYYALQVKTNGEEKFIRLFKSQNPGTAFTFHFPKRIIDERKGGKVKSVKKPVYPGGYVFLETTSDENIHQFLPLFRETEGFFQFLKSNRNITPLVKNDLEQVLHFLKLGPVIGKSKVTFDENSRIIILEGPLLGLEGRIIKVDRRKKKVKIRLNLCNYSHSIDLAFEAVERQKVI